MVRRLTSDEVATAAELAGVPPALALAVYRQESNSGADARTSAKGARGGFQVMPTTFARYGSGDIDDPVDNMHAGLAVLADGLRQARGDWEGAAQRYYHGRVLPPGVEGPDSGVGTPTTRAYGRQVADRARRIAKDRGEADVNVAKAPTEDTDVSAQQFGTPPQQFDLSSLEDLANLDDMGDNENIPGFTGPLTASSDSFGGGEDEENLNSEGSMNYALDEYIRQIVDEEFKSNA